MKKVKLLLRILAISLILLLISFVLPIKFCMKSYPLNCDTDFVVVRYDDTKNWWIMCGDKNGIYDWNTVSDCPVTIKGKNIQDIVSADLYKRYTPTYFILFGELETNKLYEKINGNNVLIEKNYIIQCTDWNVYKEVHSTNELRHMFSNKYLTIYDFKWFDHFRKFVWYYE